MEEAMGKFDRLMRILCALAKPGGCTTRRLSQLTGVDVRTIQRDLQFLSDRCFRIVQDHRNGPYRLERDQNLTTDEVVSLTVDHSTTLPELIGALRRGQMIRFRYGPAVHTVHPAKLAFSGQHWVLEAYERGESASFLIRRMARLELFPP